MPTVKVPGTELAYERLASEGDPLVLIHGSLQDRHSWDRVAPSLAGSLQVLTYDRRGYGESSRAPRAPAMATDTLDLANLLETLDFYPAHLVGHSYGAMIALRLAVDRPELIRSLALHEPPFVGLVEDNPTTASEGRRLREGIGQLQSLIRAGRREDAAREIVEILAGTPGAWDRFSPPVRASFVRYIDRWKEEFEDPAFLRPPEAELKDFLAPVLLTVGEQSPAFLQVVMRRLAEILPNSARKVVPDAGHSPHLTAPDRYVGLLLPFLVERVVPTS